MARKFRIGRLPKNYARKKVVSKRKRMPACQDSCRKQEPSLSSSMETCTSTEESESLPGSSSSFTSLSVADINHESFSSNDESSSHESLGNDEFSSPTIIDLVDHDGMSTTLTQTSEEPSRTLSSLNQLSLSAPLDYNECLPHITTDPLSPESSSFASSAPDKSTVSDRLYSPGDEDNPFTPTVDKEGKLSDSTSQSPLQMLVSTLKLPNQQWVIQQNEHSTAVCKI